MRVILVAGTTRTAEIDGISAAGASRELLVHTPSADAEILTYGRTVRAPVTPVSPTGCPTPAVVTRAVRELLGFDVTVVDGGLSKPTGAPAIAVGARPGRDIRERDPVPTAPGAFAAARNLGRALPDERIVVGETIPGGTTTAMAVLRALGEDVVGSTSSSLPENPLDLKERVVEAALESSDIEPGSGAHTPERTARFVGDPVLAVAAGLTAGALESGTEVVLGGGTQLLAAAALVRHAGVPERATLATTSYLAADVPRLGEAADALGLDLAVSDPGFDADDAGPLTAYADGVGKEGAAMGGALHLADDAGRLGAVADATLAVLERLNGDRHETGADREGPNGP
ncbi:nicotinate-nucleotide--dimethylbenzimidazole phosphoribosyltransferase [Halobellus sp. GM3]|uniref:nicotinate-nucleotide--dimethylbenzimidazole phosphoribosyltransferase n=1 Tax=Halobellus sp. GM3 TaxID=3458410 RepID=UPI00403DDBE1